MFNATRNIIEDDSINYIFSLCDSVSGDCRCYVLYDLIQRETGLSYSDVIIIVDYYNQRNKSRYEYLRHKLFMLVFSGYKIDILSDFDREIDRVLGDSDE